MLVTISLSVFTNCSSINWGLVHLLCLTIHDSALILVMSRSLFETVLMTIDYLLIYFESDVGLFTPSKQILMVS